MKTFTIDEILSMIGDLSKSLYSNDDYGDYDRNRGIYDLGHAIFRKMRILFIEDSNIKEWTILQTEDTAFCFKCSINVPYRGDDSQLITFHKNSEECFCSRCGQRYRINRKFDFIWIE